MPNSLRLSSSVNRTAALPHATHAAPATANVRLRPKRLRLRVSLKLSIAFIVYILYRHQPHPSTAFVTFLQKIRCLITKHLQIVATKIPGLGKPGLRNPHQLTPQPQTPTCPSLPCPSLSNPRCNPQGPETVHRGCLLR